MQANEVSGWIGEYEIIFTHKDGTVTRDKLKNRIMNVGLNMLRDGLLGTVTDMELKYLALGTDDTAVADAQTQLVAEAFRTAFVTQITAGTGVAQSTALVLDSEAIFHIKEIGVFAGAAATSSADTGIMVSRILYDRDKTNLESIQFIRTDTIARG